MRLTSILTAMALGCFVTSAVRAEIVQLEAIMNGAQNVPPVPTAGTGFAQFQLDTESGILTLNTGTYQDLIGHVHMAHLHGFAAPGEEAGVLFMLQHTGGMAGSLSIMGGQLQLKEADIQGMLAGLTYLAIHTDTFMEGEIRGQILVVPAPGALALFGLCGIIGSRRRR
jgi:hypothetical protein